MTVSGVGSTYNDYGYNRIKQPSPETEVSQVNVVSTVSNETGNEAPVDTADTSEETPKAPKTGNLENFSFDFKKNNEYNLIGATSKLEDLDVEKALSDMKKDSVLDQYKFFVKTALTSNEDGSVRQVIRMN